MDETNELNCNSMTEIVVPKMKMIDEKIAELQNIKSKLIAAQINCAGDCKEVLTA